MYASDDRSLDSAPEGSHKRGVTLAGQALILTFAIMIIGMTAMGMLVSWRIEKSVTTVEAESAVLFVNSVFEPHLQELATSNELSAGSIAALKAAIVQSGLRAEVAFVSIWKQGGLIVYSDEPYLVGRSFPQNSNPSKAWSGDVQVKFDGVVHDEDASGHKSDTSFIEIYAPVRDRGTGSIIAVVEFHEPASALEAELIASKWQIWLATALITLNMMGCILVIAVQSGRIIDRQRLALIDRVSQLAELLRQNRLLQKRIEQAARRATEDNERVLRRMGYDLHDGVAQLVSLALLRLDKIKASVQDRDNLQRIHKALSDALDDIRNICNGLLLPEVRSMTIKEALAFMIRTHERRTGTTTEATIKDLPEQAPEFVKLALCRFVQEGLSNAFKHAGGHGQRIEAAWDGVTLTVEVGDRGPGMCEANGTIRRPGLGLAGLRDRIESIGGNVTMKSAPDTGTCIKATLPLVMDVYDAA